MPHSQHGMSGSENKWQMSIISNKFKVCNALSQVIYKLVRSRGIPQGQTKVTKTP
jgi:hypothetical protein